MLELLEFIVFMLSLSWRQFCYLLLALTTLLTGIIAAALWPYRGSPSDVMSGCLMLGLTIAGGVVLVRGFIRHIRS
jgi:predicted RND superfamily exporter protein